MNLSELKDNLAGKTRDELVTLIFSLSSFDQLLSARQIAAASGMSKRTVLQAMKSGAFVDPLCGRGFFCRASNSLRVSAAAANAWRRSFFVPVNPITGHKKDTLPSILESEEDSRRSARAAMSESFGVAPEIGVGGKKIAQKASPDLRTEHQKIMDSIREMSPTYLVSEMLSDRAK